MPALASGASAAGSTLVALPAGTATGTYTILAQADGDNVLAERNETNNVTTRTLRVGPDLVASVRGIVGVPTAGATIVQDSTSNPSAVPMPQSTTGYYVSTDNRLDAGDILIGQRMVPALAAGGASVASAQVVMPAGTVTGPYYILNWSGLNVAHIRPTYFAEWLLYLAPMIRQGVMYAPFTTGRHAPIAGEDQARVVVGILEHPDDHRAQVYPLYGPVELTHDEIADIVGRVLGKTITYQSMPIEKWGEMIAGAKTDGAPRNDAASLYAEADRITGRPGSEFLIQHLREVAIDHTNGVFAGTNDLVEKIGGRPPLTVEAFVSKHRNAFA